MEMTPRTGAKEFAELTIHQLTHMQTVIGQSTGLGQPTRSLDQGSAETEFITESRKLDNATEELKELLNHLLIRTEIIRVSIPPTLAGLEKDKVEPNLSSLGRFLRSQGKKVRHACDIIQSILSEMRI